MLASYWSDITCGDSCWHAREAVCHCSCGGKNHGCLRTKEGTQPVRTAKIDGTMYELVAVGVRKDLWDQAAALTQRFGFSSIQPYGPNSLCHYTWSETEKRSPARLKYASTAQLEKWPELKAYRTMDKWERSNVSLLWQRTEQQALRYCEGECKKCADHKAKYQSIEK